VKVDDVVPWSRTTLYEGNFTAFFSDYDGVLELPHTGIAHQKIRLKRHGNFHTRRDVQEGSTAPYGSMKSSELVIGDGDEFHEVFLHKIGVLPHSAFHIEEDNAHLFKLFLHVLIDNLRVELSSHTREVLSFRFRYPEFIESLFHLFWNFFPGGALLRVGFYVGDYLSEVEAGYVHTESGIVPLVEHFQ